jgi:uncharacterized membrane protein YoaK (UPF0700 family)
MPLLALTAASAGADAICYLRLGHVFPANMTGNTVLLGIGIARGDYAAAARSGCALGGFVLGAAAAAAAPDRPGRASAGRVVLLAELATLVTFAAWWLAAGTAAGAIRAGLIILAGLAMGLQSGTVARLHIPGVSTTYITGTWTALSTWIGASLRRDDTAPGADHSRAPARALQVAVLTCYVGVAVVSGYLSRGLGAGAAAAPAVALLIAVGTVFGSDPQAGRESGRPSGGNRSASGSDPDLHR